MLGRQGNKETVGTGAGGDGDSKREHMLLGDGNWGSWQVWGPGGGRHGGCSSRRKLTSYSAERARAQDAWAMVKATGLPPEADSWMVVAWGGVWGLLG